MGEPFKRFRQRRIDETVRLQHREARLDRGDFIWPLFLVSGKKRREPIPSMPEVYRLSCDEAIRELELLVDLGLRSVLLFGVPDTKGIAQAWDADGIVQRSVSAIKTRFPAMEIITDVCLCSYSSDGHCHTGDNDGTCELLARIAVSHGRAGADVVAPSAMMDGQVWHIRRGLDAAGLAGTRLLSYAAKFASGYYGPFRDAADCAPRKGDRKTYQMDPANGTEALDEIAADIDEGADAVIVKPALAYLDIVNRAASRFAMPVIAYNVSGEYAMLLHAVQEGMLAEGTITETLLSVKRAGASQIISYFVPRILASYPEVL